MTQNRLILFIVAVWMAFSCSQAMPQADPEPKPAPEPVDEDKYGVAYVFDLTALPQVHVSVPLDQWNKLLDMYDRNNRTKQYVHGSASFTKNGETAEIDDIGIRLRGNTSRRRPEGNAGEHHTAGKTDWNHCHFGLNFRKYQKDDDHEIHGCRKANLKWFKDDALYAREVYCYDLFRRFGIWTAVGSSYCRLWLKVDGDPKETYYGVYQLQESIDTRYLKQRKKLFGDDGGNLWKCRGGAGLNSTDANYGVDLGGDEEYTYELKTEDNDFEAAKTQLKGFIKALNTKKDEAFRAWISSVCDVELLLRTYAVNVAVGMWDDYWNNANNYYLYFNSTDPEKYKVFFIPYDYDNTLGTSYNSGIQTDSGRQDPFNWGGGNNPLIYKLLKYDEYRKIYSDALLELASDSKDYLKWSLSAGRIREWEGMVAPYVSNDTGEDMEIRDVPASWGNHPEYRVLENGPDNFIKVKIETINKYCKK